MAEATPAPKQRFSVTTRSSSVAAAPASSGSPVVAADATSAPVTPRGSGSQVPVPPQVPTPAGYTSQPTTPRTTLARLNDAEIMVKFRSFLQYEEEQFQRERKSQQQQQQRVEGDIGAARDPIPVTAPAAPAAPPRPRGSALRRDGYFAADPQSQQPDSVENPSNQYDPRWIAARVQNRIRVQKNPWYNAAEEVAGRVGLETEHLLTGVIPPIHTAEDIAEQQLQQMARADQGFGPMPPPMTMQPGGTVQPQQQQRRVPLARPPSPSGLEDEAGPPPPPRPPAGGGGKPHTQWLNLPENSGYIFYKPLLKSAMDVSLHEVRDWLKSAQPQLLDLITHPHIQSMFFNLVALNIRKIRVTAPTRNETPSIMLRDIALTKRASKHEFQTSVSVDLLDGKLWHKYDLALRSRKRKELAQQQQQRGPHGGGNNNHDDEGAAPLRPPRPASALVGQHLDDSAETMYSPHQSYEHQRDSMRSGAAQASLDRNQEFFELILAAGNNGSRGRRY